MLESRRNKTVSCLCFTHLLVIVGLHVANLPLRQAFCNCLFSSLSITFTSAASTATGLHLTAQQIPALQLHLSSSSSISNLSTHNSRCGILLSSCDILIHCPHFLCYSFIFCSISDKNIIYSLSQFLHLILSVLVSYNGLCCIFATTLRAPQNYNVNFFNVNKGQWGRWMPVDMKNKSECTLLPPTQGPILSISISPSSFPVVFHRPLRL